MSVDIKQVWPLHVKLSAERQAARDMKYKLSAAIIRLKNAIGEIEEAKRLEYTGWFAMLTRVDGKWTCVGCYCPDDDPDGDGFDKYGEVEVILAIPKPESLREFDGF